MALADSTLDVAAMARARALLKGPTAVPSIRPALTAAAVLALTAMAFATTMVMAPPVSRQHLTSPIPE